MTFIWNIFRGTYNCVQIFICSKETWKPQIYSKLEYSFQNSQEPSELHTYLQTQKVVTHP
jgi:hypothetical protein